MISLSMFRVSLAQKMILLAFFIFVSVPVSTHAAVEYSINGLGENFSIGSSGGGAVGYAPGQSGSTLTITTGTPFWTTTATINKIRVKRVSGVACSALEANVGLSIFILPWAAPNTYTADGIGTAVGDYCDFSFTSTAIPSGTGINYIAFSPSGGDIVLDGSSENPGSSYDGDNNEYLDGGFAIQFCSSGTCGTFGPTPATVQVDNPVASSTINDFLYWNVSFVQPDLDSSAHQVRYSATTTGFTSCTGFYTCPAGMFVDTGTARTATTSAQNIAKSRALSPGVWYYQAVLLNFTDGVVTATSSIQHFTISTSTPSGPAYSTSTTPTSATSSQPYSAPTPLVCDTFDIACYLKNAFVWLFYPTTESVSQFTTLSLATTFPFSYIYDVGNIYTELMSQTATSSLTISVPFHTVASSTAALTILSQTQLTSVPYAGYIRLVLTWVLYFMFAMHIYRRVMTAFNRETTPA